MDGGYGAGSTYFTPQASSTFREAKPLLERRLRRTFATFKPVSCSRQVVSGENYHFTADVGGGKLLEFTVHRPLRGNIVLESP
mmetsp:Transcript_5558/g.10097  ORF Transcript_5558/g.10097 Transcript_5558/m.10097 type:complete len:83 (-) Transcript_5558:97-345(-)